MTSHIQPPGVLFLINTWVVGGTETQVLNLLRYLDRSRFTPYVCSLYADAKLGSAMASVGVPTISLGIRRMRYPDSILRLARLARFCRAKGVRVIQGVRTDQVALAVGRMAGVPVVLGSQRDIVWGGRSRWRTLRGFFDGWLSGVIANSRAAADYRRSYSHIPADRVHIIPNGLDLDGFVADTGPELSRSALGIPAEAPLLVILGRLEIAIKGHAILLDALQRPGLEGCHLVVAGDGRDRARMEALIVELGLVGRVHLLGHRSDAGRVLGFGDMAVVASLHESSPNVILEAWAAGRPVVATRVGGIPELVADGEHGLLVPPDDAEALAMAIRRLLEDDQLCTRLATAGHAKMLRDHTAPVMAARFADLFDQLLHARGESWQIRRAH